MAAYMSVQPVGEEGCGQGPDEPEPPDCQQPRGQRAIR